jgi:site-specific recombinase XerD
MKYIKEYIKTDGTKVFHVSIRQQGVKICQKFLDKSLAEIFIRHTLTDIDRKKIDTYEEKKCFVELANLYKNEQLPQLKHEMNEIRLVDKLVSDFRLLLNTTGPLYLTAKDISMYVKSKKKILKPSSIHKRVNRIKQIYQYAIEEEHMKIVNPAIDTKKPAKHDDSRDRRPTFSELKLIRKNASSEMWASIKIAILTCMRKAEWVNRNFRFEKNKNGYLIILDDHKTVKHVGKRKIPISNKAFNLLMRNDLPSYEALKSQWQRLMKKLNIIDLRFNDMRHEGISRLFEKGWQIPEVAMISGHKDWKMLKRYTNLRPENLLWKLN